MYRSADGKGWKRKKWSRRSLECLAARLVLALLQVLHHGDGNSLKQQDRPKSVEVPLVSLAMGHVGHAQDTRRLGQSRALVHRELRLASQRNSTQVQHQRDQQSLAEGRAPTTDRGGSCIHPRAVNLLVLLPRLRRLGKDSSSEMPSLFAALCHCLVFLFVCLLFLNALN